MPSLSRVCSAPDEPCIRAGGQLTEAVRRKPYSVILFDEVEKAHADVFNLLLQVLDDGRITDSQGRVVSFKNSIIIMTSNLGSTFILEDPATARDKVMQAVQMHFRPEFINRVDEFVIFDALKKDEIKKIVRLQAHRVAMRLMDKKMALDLRESAVEFLADKGFDPVFGARPVKRAVQRDLETVLAKAILRGEYGEGDTVVVEADSRGLTLSIGHLGAAAVGESYGVGAGVA
jgi:ATP-dependent Clp protease ATP-binding subunit ClpB